MGWIIFWVIAFVVVVSWLAVDESKAQIRLQNSVDKTVREEEALRTRHVKAITEYFEAENRKRGH